jgi:hypothetical protein
VIRTYRNGENVYEFARVKYGISRDKFRPILHSLISLEDRQARLAEQYRDKYHNADVVAALKSVPCENRDTGPTVYEYQRAADHDPALPSVPLLCNRFGTYNAALAAAGFRRKTGPRSDRQWTQHRVEQSLTLIADALGELPSIQEYQRLKKPEWPSSATIRIRMGTWSNARAFVEQARR